MSVVGQPAMPKAAHSGRERRNEIYFQQVKVELRSLWPPYPLSHFVFQQEYHDIPSPHPHVLQCTTFVVDKVAMQEFWMLVSEEADVPRGGQCKLRGRAAKTDMNH